MTLQVAAALLAIALSVIAATSMAVGALVVLPPSGWEQLPWPERARLALPVRVAPFLTLVLMGPILPVIGAFFGAILGYPLSVKLVMGLYFLALLAATAVGMFCVYRIAPRRPPLGDWLAGCMSAILFGFPNVIVYSATAIAIVIFPHDLFTVLGLLAMGAVGMGFAAWGGGIWVARALGLARPALPRAANAADWAGERVGIRASSVFELQWPRVRVDAFVFSRYLVVTDAAAELLTDQELMALSVRELTFFQQPWLTGTLRVVDSAVIFFLLACVTISATIGRHAFLMGILLAYVVAFSIRPFVRRAQIKADALAAQQAIDPTASLKALERQYELNLTPVVALTRRSRDAHLYDRMVAAGVPPAYPRPAPPSKGKILLSVAAAIGTCLILSGVFLMAIMTLYGR